MEPTDIENSPYSLEFSVFNTGYVGRIKKRISKKGFEQFIYTFVGKKKTTYGRCEKYFCKMSGFGDPPPPGLSL